MRLRNLWQPHNKFGLFHSLYLFYIERKKKSQKRNPHRFQLTHMWSSPSDWGALNTDIWRNTDVLHVCFTNTYKYWIYNALGNFLFAKKTRKKENTVNHKQKINEKGEFDNIFAWSKTKVEVNRSVILIYWPLWDQHKTSLLIFQNKGRSIVKDLWHGHKKKHFKTPSIREFTLM